MIENTNDPVNGFSMITRYQYPNHQGSTTLETDESGNIITYEEYHPLGTTSYQATNGSVTAADKRYRYTGMERDDETGLEYHNARYYISWLGRWMNCDPIGIGDGVNVYAYCGNSPVGNVDSSGTQTAAMGMKFKPEMFAPAKPNNTLAKGLAPTADKSAFSLQTKPVNILTREQKLKVEAAKQFTVMINTINNKIPDRLYDAADPSSPGGDKYSDGYIAAYQTRKIMENKDLKWYHKASFLFYMYGPTMLSTAGAGIVAKQGIQNMRTPYRDTRITLASTNFNKNELRLDQAYGPKAISFMQNPQGITAEQFQKISDVIFEKLKIPTKDVLIQGSRASYTAGQTSDLDIMVVVPEKHYNDLVKGFFQNAKPGNANEKSMFKSLETGKISTGRAKLGDIRDALQNELGIKVQISVIRANSSFDNGAQIPIKSQKN